MAMTVFARSGLVVRAANNPFGTKAKKASSASVGGGSGTGKWTGSKDAGSDLSLWYGPSRRTFLPPGLLFEIPDYLNGDLAGDYAYDPLGLGQDEETVLKLREYELLHARWAMVGTAGMFLPEAIAAGGADIKGATWFSTGGIYLGGDTLNYLAAPFKLFENPLPLAVIVATQLILMGAAENYRASMEGPAGYAPGVGAFEGDIFAGLDNLNPGGPFDPLGLADDPDAFAELKVKEIKNGRLAMVAALGYFVQAGVTKEGPYANWTKHVSDPFGYNLLTIAGTGDRTPSL